MILDAIYRATTAIVADTIALWDPLGAARYRARRESYRGYAATSPRGPYASYRPTNKSGDSESNPTRAAANAKVRDLVRNNPLVAGLAIRWPTLIIGDEIGVKPAIKIGDTPATGLNNELSRRFYRWAETGMADGRSLTEAFHLIESHKLQDGEGLVVDAEVPGAGNPYRIQVLETDHLDTSKDNYGIKFDEHGKPALYHIYPTHPADSMATLSASKPIPADKVYLFVRSLRASQRRGMSPLVSAVNKLFGVDDLEDAELISSRAGASYGLLIQSNDPYAGSNPNDSRTKSTDAAGRAMESLPAGGVFRAAPGESVTAFSSNRPNSNFDTFIRSRDCKSVGSAGISYETGTGDYSRSNFVSLRLGQNVERAIIKRHQAEDRAILNWIYRKWLAREVLLGVPGLTATMLDSDPLRFQEVTWQLAGFPGANPLEDLQALALALHLGVGCREDWCAEKGSDFAEVVTKLQAEKVALVAADVYQEDPAISGATNTSVTIASEGKPGPEEVGK